MGASAKGHSDIVKQLVEKGADWNPKNLGGQTALTLAKKNSHTAVVDYLQSKGATE